MEYLQIGGDGLFQEIMNGVLAVRALGSEAGAILKSWRLGHIPAGSTDAVAYSINGTRSAETAALHIALGDRSPTLPLPHLSPLPILIQQTYLVYCSQHLLMTLRLPSAIVSYKSIEKELLV